MARNHGKDEVLALRAELAAARHVAEQAQLKAYEAEARAARVAAINADLLAFIRG